MGIRFRRRIKLFPGVSINVSSTGVSTSIGRPGSTINVGGRGVRATVGIPGTGVSYSEKLSGSSDHGQEPKEMGFGTLLMRAFVLSFLALMLYGVFRH